MSHQSSWQLLPTAGESEAWLPLDPKESHHLSSLGNCLAPLRVLEDKGRLGTLFTPPKEMCDEHRIPGPKKQGSGIAPHLPLNSQHSRRASPMSTVPRPPIPTPVPLPCPGSGAGLSTAEQMPFSTQNHSTSEALLCMKRTVMCMKKYFFPVRGSLR